MGISAEEYGAELNAYGFEIIAPVENGKVTAIRFSTLAAICEALDCDAGDILEYQKDDAPHAQ